MSDPALIFDAGIVGPGTHVLLVGIGTYPHLIGGSDERAAIADGMEQLSTPAPSVRSLANWFLETFHNPDAPLASLAMILSEPGPATFVHDRAPSAPATLPEGTASQTVDAIRAWVERASEHPDSLAIFYFCGHGIFSGNEVLFCRDYGAQIEDRFDGSLNFTSLFNVMQTKPIGRQLFFADACRSPARIIDVLGVESSPGRRPLSANLMGAKAAAQSVYLATSTLQPSYGRTDGPSFYAEALLRALDSGGAQPDMEMWVGSNGLHTAVSTYAARAAALHGLEQEPDLIRSARFRIHKPSVVRVPVYLTCDPADAFLSSFDLTALSDLGPVHFSHDAAANGNCAHMEIALDYDKYSLAATFHPGAPYTKGTGSVLANPPESFASLSIT